MATIEKGHEIMTLVNVFTVAPDNQRRLVELLVEATEQTMKSLPGFISANIHRSLDGRTVINYAQWRSKADFEAMQKNPSAKTHMEQAGAIATFQPIVCEVVDAIDGAHSGGRLRNSIDSVR